MSKSLLLQRVMALDFMAIDLALFLNTHPHDKKAIETYCSVAAEGKKARREYEEAFGPLCPSNAAEDGKWNWIAEPWPWECEANIDL